MVYKQTMFGSDCWLLGCVVSGSNIIKDGEKGGPTQEWPIQCNVYDLHSFSGPATLWELVRSSSCILKLEYWD